ncbi:hypothetical protein [Collimonas silvisoli]|uniref:hypothetical protein n=1 Tax=Collimonas silvisoli TaxID=2825884 RepID=UPI001B8D08DF|nr:hypothetical protein [Collimonas silvisoli]
MDSIKLKLHAELLETEIRMNLGKSRDVDWLANYAPLLKALEDAKGNLIHKPRDLGLGRWEMESNIQDFRTISHRLAQFELLLEGWDLPSERGV